ncbi:MAG: ATP-dependent 6-phosphofructokinase [Lachnospiraceae bacterium]|nr:ATP-dependent 6-phosphofructokinase [Lachnospiraceae bacterium]
MNGEIKTIGVLTSGGDAPGMNAAVRAVTRTAITHGYIVKGIRRGYHGLLKEEIEELNSKSVSDIIHRGGTVLGTARSKSMMTPEGQDRAAYILKKHGIDCLVAIGGDGSLKGAASIMARGIPVIGIPATIDMDVACTEYTIGFDTAVNTALDALDKIRDTSASHERVSIIEVMGRGAGYIALWVGLAGGAEDVLARETYDGNEQVIVDHIIENRALGKRHHIIVNAESVGDSEELAKRIETVTGIETRATILGYLQRGGSPTCRDRVAASVFGEKAIELIDKGELNKVVVFRGNVPLGEDIRTVITSEQEMTDLEYLNPRKLVRT